MIYFYRSWLFLHVIRKSLTSTFTYFTYLYISFHYTRYRFLIVKKKTQFTKSKKPTGFNYNLCIPVSPAQLQSLSTKLMKWLKQVH